MFVNPNGTIGAGLGEDPKIERIYRRIHTQIVNLDRKAKNPIDDIDDYKKILETLRELVPQAVTKGLALNDSRTPVLNEFKRLFCDDAYHKRADEQLERKIHDVSPLRELLNFWVSCGYTVENSKPWKENTKATILTCFKKYGLPELTEEQDDFLNDKIERTLSNHFATKQI